MFALISDIAARSGSSSPASWSSSSLLRERYSSPMRSPLVALRDVPGLLCVRIRDGVVARHVEGDRCVDRSCDIRVDQRHRGPLWQLLAGELLELFAAQLLVVLRCVL